MTLNDIPTDSILRHWVTYLSMSEVPFSYQIAAGLSGIGTLLKRNVYIDQVEWRVFPNQSVLFIGPSGIGKDTIINRTTKMIQRFEDRTRIPVLGGMTLEAVHAKLLELPKPAVAFIPAGELTAFFGQRDYQSNMVQGFTDLLSSNEKIDISTKSGMYVNGMYTGKGRYIYQPTITMHGGSTVEWLHTTMPDGTMEGGFLGRFLIMPEEFSGRHVPLVKSNKSASELRWFTERLNNFHQGVETILYKTSSKQQEVILLDDAEDYYANWYHNRFKYFSKVVMPYANRSRDMVLRLAMLMAISRHHYRWIDLDDIKFATSVLHLVAQKIDKVVQPLSNDAQCAEMILTLLPASTDELWRKLGYKFPVQVLQRAEQLLKTQGRIRQDKHGVWKEVS